ncbi:type VI secretion system Vgr family protein [Aureimonas pseudogalii]|uniref:Type VI secretion system secreted protein VgrG n=1 Tax=Aureimonas pseudogalii TaxID=1744844 RepID=A0A7W6H8D4_9HYPH|nr:type VI secretion system tip protein TssI/VgrG [Aureimonas pseudogalii]MBB4000432.1 type VI secretion system secreted protein VgrG [Aureimonas pseudogalii]
MSTVSLSQDQRWLRLQTPLGKDVVVVEEMEGREALSRLFSFHLRGMCTPTFGASDLLGQAVSLTMSRFADETRLIHGIVTGFRFGPQLRSGYRRCALDIEPTLAVLRHSSNYRIFQEKSVVDIASAILGERDVNAFRFEIVGTKTPRAYCVQFGETDLDFICRLFDEEGYFFFFEHTDGAHTLVVCDSAVKYASASGPALRHVEHSIEGERLVQSIMLHRRLTDTKWSFRQFDFAAPSTAIEGSSESSLSPTRGWEHFAYGEGAALSARQRGAATRNVDAADATIEEIEGQSTAASLVPGRKFSIESDSFAEVALADDASVSGESFVISEIEHRLIDSSFFNNKVEDDGKPVYSNRFKAIPASRTARPAIHIAKPRAHGPQTATVVGPSNSEVYTDAHGRVRVQFHWDRLGQHDEQSSCFIRVAQSWAGKGWGTQFIPRVGMEVVVHFLNGDPDQPVVTGALYNGDCTPPFALPGEMNKSGLRTRSTKTGDTTTFNELSFDDTKEKEQVLFHAQKDFRRVVENDDVVDIGHDQTRTIKNDRTTTIADGNDTLTLSKGNRSETLSQGDETLTIAQGNRTASLTKGNDALKLGSGNLSIALQGGNMTVELQAGNLSQTCAAGSVTIEALRGITLKCGQSTIEVTPQGVTIKGPMVTTQATGKAELSGLLVDVKGSGMTQINGGLVKIN